MKTKNFDVVSDAELLSRTYDEITFLIEGLIVSIGVCLVVAPPKMGKSFLMLFLAVMLCYGQPIFGLPAKAPMHGLYLALEDNEARLQRRLKRFNLNANGQLYLTTKIASGEKGIEELRLYLKEHPETRFIIVDTLGFFFKDSSVKSSNAFLDDYERIGRFKSLAEEFKCAIILVHHTRKMPDFSDELNEVSGTSGVTAAADSIMMLRRTRGQNNAILTSTGRDSEDVRLALDVDFETGQWSVSQEEANEAMTSERRLIRDLLKSQNRAMRPAEIARLVHKEAKTISSTLKKMQDNGLVEPGPKYGFYMLPDDTDNPCSS